MLASSTNQATSQVQQSGMPVSFASTTGQVRHPCPSYCEHKLCPLLLQPGSTLSQIPSIASTANSQQVAPPIQMTADPCRKCGKKNHPTDRCCSKVTCKNCKGKDHGTMFCTVATKTARYNCTFCRKGKHSIENCRAKKKAERRTQMRATDLVTTNDALNVMSIDRTAHCSFRTSLPVTAIQMPQITITLPNTSVPPTYRAEATTNGQWC